MYYIAFHHSELLIHFISGDDLLRLLKVSFANVGIRGSLRYDLCMMVIDLTEGYDVRVPFPGIITLWRQGKDVDQMVGQRSSLPIGITSVVIAKCWLPLKIAINRTCLFRGFRTIGLGSYVVLLET